MGFSRILYWQVCRPHAAGETFALYLILYSLSRFVVEFFRFHEQSSHSGLSITQWISLGMLVAGIWLTLARRHAPKLASAV